MSSIEPLSSLLKIDFCKYTRSEKLILEAEFFLYVYSELKRTFRSYYQEYFELFNFSKQMEESMIEENFVRCILNDLLSMNDYSIAGISFYTQIPEDVIYELAIGQNTNPTLQSIRKIMELHRLQRPNLYQAIVKKMVNEYQESDSD